MDGELQASEEPSEPEWGNLPTVMSRRRSLNRIGDQVGTAGTETSQYREERKSTRDSRSSGERNGISPNRRVFGRGGVVGAQRLQAQVCGAF